MRLAGRGHAAVRATHDKTMELATGDDLTERGTCVIGVRLRADESGPLAGPVRVTVAAGDHRFAFDANANPSWTPRDPGGAVIRRGPLRLPGTLATDATAAASDLPRDLVTALTDPAATVTVTLEPSPAPPAVVLFAADPMRADPRLAAERAAADVIVAEDDAARHLLGRDAHASSGLSAVIGRVLVVATRELPGASVPRDTVPVETVGLAPQLAAAAAAPGRGPVTIGSHRDGEALLVRVPPGNRLVLDSDRGGLPSLLAAARRVRGNRHAVVVQEFGQPVRLDTDHDDPAALFPGADRLWCCLVPAPRTELDPMAQHVALDLLAENVATRAVARAVASLTGRPHREAYEAVLALRDAGRADE